MFQLKIVFSDLHLICTWIFVVFDAPAGEQPYLMCFILSYKSSKKYKMHG